MASTDSDRRALSVALQVLLLLLASLNAPVRAGDAGDWRTRLDGLARKLGDPSWEVREKATKELRAFGDLALTVVFPLLSDEDPEVRVRASRVVSAYRESPLLLREAFRAGPAGARWAFEAVRRGHHPNDTALGTALEKVIQAAGAYGSQDCIPYLVTCLAEERDYAGEALALLGFPKACLEALQHAYDTRSAPQFLPAIGGLGSKEAKRFLLRKASRGSEEEKKWASEGLQRFRLAGRARLLAFALLDGGRLARRQARFLLLSAPQDLRIRVADLVLRKGADRDQRKIFDLVDGPLSSGYVPPALFGFRRAPRLLDGLLSALAGDSDPGMRFRSVMLLVEYPEDPRARAVLASAMTDPLFGETARFRLETIGGFAPIALAEHLTTPGNPVPEDWDLLIDRVPGKGKVYALSRILREGPASCMPGAAESLVMVGSPRAVEALLAGSARRSCFRECVAGLGRLGETAGLEILGRFVDDPSPPADLVEGLGRTGDERAGRILLSFLGRPHLAGPALRGLGRLKEARFLPILLRALLHDRHWGEAMDGIVLMDSAEALPFLKRYMAAARSGGYFDRAERASWVATILEGNPR